MKYLKEEEVKIRNKIIRESWRKYKGLIEMSRLAKIFNMDLGYLYRILIKYEKVGKDFRRSNKRI